MRESHGDLYSPLEYKLNEDTVQQQGETAHHSNESRPWPHPVSFSKRPTHDLNYRHSHGQFYFVLVIHLQTPF